MMPLDLTGRPKAARAYLVGLKDPSASLKTRQWAKRHRAQAQKHSRILTSKNVHSVGTKTYKLLRADSLLPRLAFVCSRDKEVLF